MLETKYYKDFRHNYVILKLADPMADLYQCRMITANRIDGLLPCQERHINGEMLLYYEITSKQNLASLYENARIGIRQLRQLFMQLKIVGEGMSGFLLNEGNLVLRPEYIYADVETKELSFLYYPCETQERYISSLLDFLLGRIDSEDGEAVELTYKMLELVERDQFVLDEVLQWFDQDYEERAEEKTGERQEERYGFQEPEPEEEPVEEYKTPQPQEEGKTVKSREKTALGWMLAGALSFVLLSYISRTFYLSERESVYLIAGFFLVGALFVASGAYLIFLKKRKGYAAVSNESTEKPYQETFVCEKARETADRAHGNTVFIPWVENSENKLYGIGKGNKNHIDLSRLPLTAGKLAGSVDMVINDQSISRRHVRFAREENRIYMTDLNSTNGTFKNGLRLEPNMSVVLEPGDEIRLGRLKFVYR